MNECMPLQTGPGEFVDSLISLLRIVWFWWNLTDWCIMV